MPVEISEGVLETFMLIRSVLAWCIVIDLVLLLWWFGVFVFARGFVYRLHTKWFPMSEERFNVIHYSGMMIFKVAMILFHFGPYLALHIVM